MWLQAAIFSEISGLTDRQARRIFASSQFNGHAIGIRSVPCPGGSQKEVWSKSLPAHLQQRLRDLKAEAIAPETLRVDEKGLAEHNWKLAVIRPIIAHPWGSPERRATLRALVGTSTVDWTGEPDSAPMVDIEEAKDRVRTTCGVEPNRMAISNAGFKALKHHPKIVERFKYTTAESVTAKMLAGLFDLDEIAVGKAVYLDGTDPADRTFREAWDNVAVLAYTPTQDASIEQPSFGYTYTYKGHPFVEPARWEGGKRSWVYGVTYERKPLLTGIASGFLFTGITGA